MWLLNEGVYAVRGLRRAPIFAAAFVVTLGLAIGANTAVYSVARAVFVRPLPHENPSGLVFISHSAPGFRMDQLHFSVPEVQDFRQGARTITNFGEFSTMNFAFFGLGDPRQVRGGVVDGQYFRVLGLKPVLGRLIGPDDEGPTANGVVVLTYRFWSEELGRDPDVIGKAVRLHRRAAEVIGVLEPAPPFPVDTELFANVVTSPHHLGAAMQTDRRHRMTQLFGRLAPGATVDGARRELREIQGRLKRAHPQAYDAAGNYTLDVAPLQDHLTKDARATIVLLLVTAGLVLIIACANLANLILSRVLARQAEFATRQALGIRVSAARLTTGLEALVLAVVGAGLGIALAYAAIGPLRRFIAILTIRAIDVPLDTAVLWGSVAAALGVAMLATLIAPSLRRGDALRVSTVRHTNVSGLQRALVVSQIALCLALLVPAAMLARTLRHLQSQEVGISARQVLAMNVPIVNDGRTPRQIAAQFAEIQRRLAELPGVEAAAIGSVVPLQEPVSTSNGVQFNVDGPEGSVPGFEARRADSRSVSPGYFATLGIPIVDGRDFTDDDDQTAEKRVIISQSIKDRVFGGRDPVGRQLAWTDERLRFVGGNTDFRRIVGVAADVRERGIEQAPEMIVYHPFWQEPAGARVFVRASGEAAAIEEPVRRALRAASPDQPVNVLGTLEEFHSEALAPSRLSAGVTGGFATLALIMAAVGVAGLLGHAVTARTREFGIRLALGARPGSLLWRVMIETAWLVGLGLAIGGALAFGVTRIIQSVLRGVTATDAAPIALATLLLLAVALVAAAIPASRVARIDPTRTLRVE